MNFGLPYAGSKNSIAQKIVNFLPKAEHLYDLFGGGGAITHCALLSGKYKYIHYNEINPVVYKGFKMAINGEFKNENRWISREDFFKLKNTDPYVALCFSFGNFLRTYAYSPEAEPVKKAFHYAVCFDDYSLLDVYLGQNKIRLKRNGIENRRIELQHYLTYLFDNNVQSKVYEYCIADYDSVRAICQNLERLNRIQNLERLNRIQNLECLHKTKISNDSYENIEIDDNSIVYCDIPYRDTGSYKQGDEYQIFDYDKFYAWCSKQKQLTFISEYDMPDNFIKVFSIDKRVTMSNTKSDDGYLAQSENLYIPKNQLDLFNELKYIEDW